MTALIEAIHPYAIEAVTLMLQLGSGAMAGGAAEGKRLAKKS
jgi:hypothetical protein